MAISAAALSGSADQQSPAAPKLELKPLPFEPSELEPYISAKTLSFHYGKHHQAYVTTLGKLIAGTSYEGKDLVEIIRQSKAAGESQQGIFNNAAQAWNHRFYWNSLSPTGKNQKPSAELLQAIKQRFGSLDQCLEAFSKAALTQFGSGWAWLVAKQGKVDIVKTSNADTPIADPAVTPLLTIDVWEHAYYLDWQNKRAGYVRAILDHLLNWNFASKNFAASQK